MPDWTSTVTTWQPEWMRSTTQARLELCRAAHPGSVDEWGSPSPGRVFTNIGRPGERVAPAASNQPELAMIFDASSDLQDAAQALKDGGHTLSDATEFLSSEQPRGQRCLSCGKALPRVTFIEADHEATLKCDCAPQPDALMLILDEVRATRELLQRWDVEGMPAKRSER